MLHKFQNISTFSLNGRRVDLDLEDAHREVCPPVCWVQVVLGVIRHVQVRPESMNILWNKGRSHEKKLLFVWILSKLLTSISTYKYRHKTTNIKMMTCSPIKIPDEKQHKSKYKYKNKTKNTMMMTYLPTYLLFVIFFTQTKILENEIYTEKTRKLRQNTQ